MRLPVAATLALLLVFAGIAPVGGSPAAGPSTVAPAPAALDAGFAQTGEIDADRVVLEARLRPNGDARWRIAYRIELSDENTTAAFESLRADIRENSTPYVDRFASRMTGTVAAAENATGREMAATNFSVTAQRNPFPASSDYGVVAYSFTWEGFAASPGERLLAGDALAGLFLDSGTVLTIAWPAEYEVRSVAPEADERSATSVTWRGERNFGPDQPRVTVAPAAALPVRPAYLAAAALLLLLGAGLVLRRRGGLPAAGRVADALADRGEGSTVPSAGSAAAEGTAAAAADADAGDGPGGERALAADADAEADTDTERDATAGGATGATGTGADAAPDAEPDDATPPEELLSPHERVTRLVEANGGRMKQADVTEELGWSAARTSQVVGDLRDDGTLESFRLGRENVLRLPDADEEPHPGDPTVRDDE